MMVPVTRAGITVGRRTCLIAGLASARPGMGGTRLPPFKYVERSAGLADKPEPGQGIARKRPL